MAKGSKSQGQGQEQPDPSDPVSVGDPLIDEARKRWSRCTEWESTARERFLDDIRFEHGDSYNSYQWPNSVRSARDTDSRPCLTMNIVKQHNLQVSNQMRKNKQSMKVIALGNGATEEAAEVFRDLIRRVEYVSDAQSAYTVAREFQIGGGIGWWRIVTDYVSPDTFDVDAFIRPVNDPLSVYMDPDIEQKSGADAQYAFVFDKMPKDEFREAFPKFRDAGDQQPLGFGTVDNDWVTKNDVLVCEYFRKVLKPDTLISFQHKGERRTIRKSLLHESMHSAILDDPQTRYRTVHDEVVEWFLIAGMKVIDETIWPGRFIPLIRCVGEESVIDGVLDRKGLTRSMVDAQRMYNYNASAQVEFGALQGKSPWTGAVDAIEEYETLWNTANSVNHSYLAYKHRDSEGEPIPPEALPHRIDPPTAAPLYQAGMETAANQIMMVSGQFQNQMGMLGNERTGAAIGRRQEQSDTAVFHFEDNYESALVASGKQLLDLLPRIMDTRRVLKIQAEDGADREVEVDPKARAAYLEETGHRNEVVRRIFNPNVGNYDVAASFGPAYGSKREETVEALKVIITQAPALTGVIGDLLVGALEFDKAQEASQRLKRMVPPIALGEGPSQAEQELQAQVQSLQAALAKSLERQGKEQVKLVGKDQMRDIDAYDAETKRMAALQKMLPMDEAGLRQIIGQLVQESLETSLVPILQANAPEIGEGGPGEPAPQPNPNPVQGGALGEAPPVSGAKKAPDGEWYLADPTRKGKYLHVAPLAQEHARPSVIAGAAGAS